MAHQAEKTTDHEAIRKWVEERGGHPATVARTAQKKKGGETEAGIIRIDFPGYSGEQSLEPISWDEFFKRFDTNKLAFLHQDKTDDGQLSRFCKFVHREAA